MLPLGSGALAGTALPLDREALARDLGFAAVSEGALDAVTDRDFAAEFVFACAQLQTHLARLAEDLIWHSSPEFGFFNLPGGLHDRLEPDAAEEEPRRARAGARQRRAAWTATCVRLLALMKGLPAGYQKDLQEDKGGGVRRGGTAARRSQCMTGVVAGLGLDTDADGAEPPRLEG